MTIAAKISVFGWKILSIAGDLTPVEAAGGVNLGVADRYVR
jgi:hypothetical protein